MIFCDNCLKEIVGGKFVYSPEHKHEGKKFCSTICMHEYYAPHCDQCNKQTAKWIYSTEHHDNKKFCSDYCMEQHYQALKPKIKPKPKEESKPEQKESKEIGKYRWSAIWTSIGMVFLAILCNWLVKENSEQPKEAQWLTGIMKFCYWTAIVIGVLCLIGSIYFFFYYPRLCDEVETLKTKEKFLEKEIKNQ